MADLFLDFLQTHTVDPDSALIGLVCSEEGERNARRHLDVDPSCAYTIATPGSTPSPPNYQQLCSMIVEWGVGEDDSWMKEQIQKLCATMRGVDKMEKGDVAIVGIAGEEGKKSMIFARFTGMTKNSHSHLEFFVNAEENKKDWVSSYYSTN